MLRGLVAVVVVVVGVDVVDVVDVVDEEVVEVSHGCRKAHKLLIDDVHDVSQGEKPAPASWSTIIHDDKLVVIS